MSKIGDVNNFLDVNGLHSITQKSNSTDKAEKADALNQAAKQFEAIFMQMLLKSMRSAQEVLESDSPFNSESTKFYRDMHDQQLAVELSNNGSLGLSELIVRQLGGDQESFTPNSVLRFENGITPKSNAAQSIKNAELRAQQLMDNPLLVGRTDKPVNNPAGEQASSIRQSQSEMTFNEPKDFVTALAEPAKKVEHSLGIPFEVVIAQAALETGWGQKIIKNQKGQNSNNLFNIKADNRWQGDKTIKNTLEYEQGRVVKKAEPFRVYETITDSVNDYISFLSKSERYQEALSQPNNVEHFLHNLQKSGYATDPNYAKKIMGTLKTVTGILSN